MADNTPTRKEYDSANWQVVALEQARLREAAQRRKELSEALNRWLSQQGGAWVTSMPGAKHLRIECRQGSAVPAKLVELGYSPRHCGAGIRIAFGSFAPVDILEVTLGN